MISSKTVEQLSNLDQVDHLSTNRTLRDGDSAVDVVYFDFDDLFFFLSASVEVDVHDQPDHRYQGEEKYFLQATAATSKEGSVGYVDYPRNLCLLALLKKGSRKTLQGRFLRIYRYEYEY